jgi:tetratricopeptide (TPR) repeat protein
VPIFEARRAQLLSSSNTLKTIVYLINYAGFLGSIKDPVNARLQLERVLGMPRSGADIPADLWAKSLEQLAGISPPLKQLSLLQEAITQRERITPPQPDLIALYRRVADLQRQRGETAQAFSLVRKSIALASSILPKSDPRLAAALVDLGFLHEQGEEFAAAETQYRRALAIQQRSLGPTHPEVGVTLNNLAGVVGAQGDLPQAEKLLRQALSAIERNLGPWHPKVAVCAANLGDLLAATRRTQPAKTSYQRALAIYERAGDSTAAAEIRQSLASLR